MKVLVTGAGGLVGSAVCEHCETLGDEVLSYTHRALDIADQSAVMDTVTAAKPDTIINCAAWTDVDGCESNPARAFAVNAAGPENLARAARAANALLVTISTDYVFDGTKEGFYTQRDQPNPQSVYAQSKFEGELRAQAAAARTIVVRTGYIFGPRGTNFLSTIFGRLRMHEHLKVISDTYGTPTYSRDLAVRLRELASVDIPAVFHVTNAGDGTSFASFARAAAEIEGHSQELLTEVRTADLKRPAQRPLNSRLRCLLSEPLGLRPLRSWTEALREFATFNTEREVAAKG